MYEKALEQLEEVEKWYTIAEKGLKELEQS